MQILCQSVVPHRRFILKFLFEHWNNSLILQSSIFILQLAQPYPRIDKGVKNIEGQVDEYVNQPEKETNAH